MDDAKRDRLFVVRVMGNDLWPFVSLCRTRFNLMRLLHSAMTPPSVPIHTGIFDEDTLGNQMSAGRQFPEKLDIYELWAPFHILNGTENRLLLDLLGRTHRLVFSVPVDVPTLHHAQSYITYLSNVAFARQVVYRESVSVS